VAPPSPEALARALELLHALGAIDAEGALTEPLGLRMAEFPVAPQLARMLLGSFEHGCGEEALSVAAVLSVQNPFVDPRGRAEAGARLDEAMAELGAKEGDHVTFARVYEEYAAIEAGPGGADAAASWCGEHMLRARALRRATEIRRQLAGHLARYATEDEPIASCGEDPVALLRCVVAGFFCNAVRLHHDGVYRTVRDGRPVAIHPSSVLSRFGRPPTWMVYHDATVTSREYMREVSAIDPRWLLELAPHFYQANDRSAQDGCSGQVGLPGTRKRKEVPSLVRGAAAARKKPAPAPAQHRLPNAIGKSHHGLRMQF